MYIHVTAPDGRTAKLEALEGFRVMEVIRDWAFETGIGVVAECGGACACGTCHVYVDPDWSAVLTPALDEEEDQLDETPKVEANSRLSCQILMRADLDGLRVTLADDAFQPVKVEEPEAA
ncbi:MAG: 2Fe-2S iron-sulfur cluster-binding protein [Pseudomonadota bacterium]